MNRDDNENRSFYEFLDEYKVAESELESLQQQAPVTEQEDKYSWLQQFAIDPLQGTGVPSAVEAEPRQELTRAERSRRLDEIATDVSLALGAPVISGGITDPIQRYRLQGGGRRSEEDIARSIQEYIPGAETRVVTLPNQERMVAFRRPDSEGFELINPEGLNYGDIGAALSYITTLETGVSVAAAIATKNLGIIPRMVATGLASGAGRYGDIKVDEFLGDRPKPLEDVYGDLTLAAVFGILGEAGGTAMSKGYNIARGGGVLARSPAQLEAIRIAEERGLPGYTLGQQHPLLGYVENVAGATTEPLKLRYSLQKEAARAEFEAMRREIAGDLTEDILPSGGLSDAELDELIQTRALQIRDIVDDPGISARQAQTRLQAAREDIKTRTQERLDRLYLDAMNMAGGDVSFNMNPIFELAGELTTGTQVATRTPGVTSRAEAPLDPQIRNILNRMTDRPQILTGEEGYLALKGWRTELGDIARGDYTSADAGKRRTMNIAQKLYDEVTKVIDNAEAAGRAALESPTPAGTYEEVSVIQQSDFSRAWQRATAFNKWREGILNINSLEQIANESNPVYLVNNLIQPGNYQSLRTLKRVMKPEQWKEVRDIYRSSLLRNQYSISRTFADLADEPEILDLLLTKEEQLTFRRIGLASERLNQSAAAWRAQTAEGDRMMSFINSGNKGEVVLAIEAAGGPNSVSGRRIRAGIIQEIIGPADYSKVTNEPIIKPSAVISRIDSYLEGNTLKGILTETDIKNLREMRTYLVPIAEVGDESGVSIQAAELGGSFLGIFNPDRLGASALKQASFAFAARAMTNENFAKFVFGRGVQYDSSAFIRAQAQVIASVAKDWTEEEALLISRQALEEENEYRQQTSGVSP